MQVQIYMGRFKGAKGRNHFKKNPNQTAFGMRIQVNSQPHGGQGFPFLTGRGGPKKPRIGKKNSKAFF